VDERTARFWNTTGAKIVRRKNNQWIGLTVAAASSLSAVGLMNVAGVSPFHSLATVTLYGVSMFGIERIYSALWDIAVILVKPSVPEA
jgi:uncharacterized membrane protein